MTGHSLIKRIFRAGARPASILIPALALFAVATVGDGVHGSAKAGAEIVETNGLGILVEVSNGKLVRLDKPASNIFIADPEVADIQVKSSRLVYVFGKKPGSTSLFAVSDNDEVLFSGTVTVTHDLGQVRSALQKVIPDADVKLDQLNGVLVLTGNADSPAEADDAQHVAQKFLGDGQEVVNRMNIAATTQVNLRVRVAEVSRDVSKQLGFNWEGSLGFGNSFIGIQNAADVFELVPSDVFFDALGNPLPVKEFFTNTREAGSLLGNFATGRLDLNYIIDALETEGFLTVLAEPNLTALSGEKASFLAGGEFPIPVPQENGVITIDYRTFGVALTFTPTVLSDNSINLKVQPEVSQLSSAGAITLNGFNIPALTTRRAATTVELASGQSFAVAGLLQNNIERELTKFPGLGDIPILGALFRSDRFQRQETELIIIVTPYVVRPVSGKRIPTPVDGLRMPNDMERYLHGQSYRAQPTAGPVPTADKQGRTTIAPAGFMLN
ncbi:MAG: type II and III secretion system protein family protein [Alphaproteobacteria bacterium]|nr:MAG: type II and III secretion system protein family protein [Alphaproteobacteria bacterium]